MNICRTSFLLLISSALVVAGCGSATPVSSAPVPDGRSATASTILADPSTSHPTASSVPANRPDVCSLLTRADLTPLLGADPGPGTATSDGTTAACVYTGAGAVSVVLDPAGGAVQFAMYCPHPPGQHSQDVSGLADGACLTVVGGAVAVIYLRKGNAVLSVNIQTGFAAKITPDSLIAVGHVAAARM